VTNAGTLNLTGGDTIENGALSNSGNITSTGTNTLSGETVTDDLSTTSELTVGSGTLTLNSDFFSGGVILITVDSGATLILQHTKILDAIVVTNPGGVLDVSADSSIQTINSVLSGNNIVESGATLTLINEDVTGTIDDQGTIVVEGGVNFHALTIDDDTISPGIGIDVTSGAVLLLSNVSIQGGGTGTLTVESTGQITVTTSGAVLDGVIVTNVNASKGIDVSGGVLTLNDGTVISGGAMTVESIAGSTLVITAGSGTETLEGVPDVVPDSPSGRGATLSGVTVTNNGVIEVSSATLTLSGTTINGGIVTDNGMVDVTGTSAIDSASINGGQVTVETGQTLTLDNDTVTGTTITDNGTLKIDASTTLSLSGVVLTGGAVSNAGTLNLTGGDTLASGTLGNSSVVNISGC
jgi:hypothetical protein